MDWIDRISDGTVQVLIFLGPVVAVAGGLLLLRDDKSRGAERFAHGVVCLGCASVGVGILIGSIQDSQNISHTAIIVFGVGLAVMTATYVCYIVTGWRRLSIAIRIVALFVVLSACAMLFSIDTDDCALSGPDTSEYQC